MKRKNWYVEFYDVGQYPVKVFCFRSFTECMESIESDYYDEHFSALVRRFSYKILNEKEYYGRYRGSVELWWDSMVRDLKGEGIVLEKDRGI